MRTLLLLFFLFCFFDIFSAPSLSLVRVLQDQRGRSSHMGCRVPGLAWPGRNCPDLVAR